MTARRLQPAPVTESSPPQRLGEGPGEGKASRSSLADGPLNRPICIALRDHRAFVIALATPAHCQFDLGSTAFEIQPRGDQGEAALFEGAPQFLDRLIAAGPFPTDETLFVTARAIAHAMPEDEQIELIDAHPRLGAPPGTVSAMSFVEQGYDRGTGTPLDIVAELERLNDAYEQRHGFRYCVFVAGRPREALLPDMAAAVDADRTSELHRALDAVVDIAIDRHGKLTAR